MKRNPWAAATGAGPRATVGLIKRTAGQTGECAVRSVVFSRPDDFFPVVVVDHVEKTWAQWLGPLVAELPSFETVITELRSQLGQAIR